MPAARPDPPVGGSTPTSVDEVDEVDEVDAGWLSAVLGTEVTSVAATPLDAGRAGRTYRLSVRGRGLPASLVLGLGPADPAERARSADALRAEMRFHADLASTVAVRVPRCLHASYDEEGAQAVLLLEDLVHHAPGDLVTGCSPRQAHDAARNLAGLHGPRWGDPTLLDVPGLRVTGPEDAAALAGRYAAAVERHLAGAGATLAAADRTTLRASAAVVGAWALAGADRFALTHGAYRLDHLLFRTNGATGCAAVDWQTTTLGPPARDLAVLLGTGLDPALRRQHEQSVVATYHAALVGHGVEGHPRSQTWEDYRLAMLQAPLTALLHRVDGHAERTRVVLERACAAIRDLGTLDLVSGRA